MDPEDRGWWLRAAALLLALTLLPLAVAAAATPAGMQFSGFVYEARDGVSYIAKATEGLQGHWTYHDPYTGEAQPQTLVFVPYLLIGQLDRVAGLPMALVIQAARVGLAAALLWACWRIVAGAWTVPGARRLGFLLVFLGGGVGALTGGHREIFGYHYVSLDVSVSGAQGMEALSLAPHIVLACLGSAWLLRCWVAAESKPGWRPVAGAVAWTLAVALAYPQMAAMWAAVAVLAAVLSRRRAVLPVTAAIVVAAVPYAAYGLYLRRVDPVFANWPPQADIDVGDPASFLLFGHLLMLPFVVLSAWRQWRARTGGDGRLGVLGLCAVWLATATVLMYLPGLPPVMHRVFYASFIPFGVLAADGLWAWSRLRPRPSRRLLVYPAMLMCLAGAWAVGEGLAIPLLHRDDLALYLPADDAAVLRALAARDPAGRGTVMNSYLSGLFVPALSGHDTYLGFPYETLDLARKNRFAVALYRDRDTAGVARQLSEQGVAYLLFGPYERALGGSDPGAAGGWPVVATRGEATLYSVPAP